MSQWNVFICLHCLIEMVNRNHFFHCTMFMFSIVYWKYLSCEYWAWCYSTSSRTRSTAKSWTYFSNWGRIGCWIQRELWRVNQSFVLCRIRVAPGNINLSSVIPRTWICILYMSFRRTYCNHIFLFDCDKIVFDFRVSPTICHYVGSSVIFV